MWKYWTSALGTMHAGNRCGLPKPGSSRSQKRCRATRDRFPSSVGPGSIGGAVTDGSHIHIRRQRKDCIHLGCPVVLQKRWESAWHPTTTSPHGLGGAVARIRERASHYGGEPVQLIARNRARHHRCIPGKENELRIACPRRDVRSCYEKQ